MNIDHTIREFTIIAPAFLLALTVHEFSHGYLAWRLGDPTPKMLGRLTLNPMKHLDLMGTICFFLFNIGWAKPVPVNPGYFKNPKRDMLWVGLAGPGSNLLLAVASAIAAKLVLFAAPVITPFILWPLAQMIAASIWINIILAVFNLVPIPPLDGSKILMGMLPARAAASFARLEPFGFIIILVLFYTGILPKMLRPIIAMANSLIY
ncbi:MAG: peptidase [Deltaproteobacteria bacterium RIFOXYD12_FULL_50_9]|nr:MAG: peptidase [Deltaproteobacteria bacterium RIFOXYD12_FULL_50_9]